MDTLLITFYVIASYVLMYLFLQSFFCKDLPKSSAAFYFLVSPFSLVLIAILLLCTAITISCEWFIEKCPDVIYFVWDKNIVHLFEKIGNKLFPKQRTPVKDPNL